MFLQERVSAGVFMHNYFNPALIQDLRDSAFLEIKAIQLKLDKLFR